MQTAAIDDLRDWLEAVRAMDELVDVSSADWNLEIGAVSQMSYRRADPSAVLFDDIPGYPSGFRVLTGSLSNARRMALTLRMGTDYDDARLVSELTGRPLEWEARAAEFDPHVVTDGPVFENVIENNVDLLKFPAPLWNKGDGGRFIGTGCMVLTSDPVTGVINGGAYRMQVQDGGRGVTVNPVPGKHGDQHIRRWFEKEGRAPVTISLGHDPLLLLVAGTEVPTGMSELNFAGAIMGRPIDVATSEVTGLPIPVRSEIVIEGWLRPGERLPEGPFGEWTGYYSGSDAPVLSLDIARVLHRDNPILLGSPPGKPPHDYSYMRTVMKSAMIRDSLVKSGIPGVTGVWAHEAGGGRLLVTVAIDQQYCGHSRQVGYITSQCQAAAYMNRFVVVVDDDVDPTKLDEIIWAMCTRCDPAEDIDILRKTWGSKADPLLVDQSVPYNSRAVIDACRPFERLATFPAVAEVPPELMRRTEEKWAHLFR